MYPFLIILCWFVVCIRDTLSIFELEVRYFSPLSMLGNSLACCQGFFTSLYFFFINDEVVFAWRELLRGQTINNIVRSSRTRKSINSGDSEVSIARSTSMKEDYSTRYSINNQNKVHIDSQNSSDNINITNQNENMISDKELLTTEESSTTNLTTTTTTTTNINHLT